MPGLWDIRRSVDLSDLWARGGWQALLHEGRLKGTTLVVLQVMT